MKREKTAALLSAIFMLSGAGVIALSQRAGGGTIPAASTLFATDRYVAAGSLKQEPRVIDEYGDVPFDDEKARLDTFAIELQQDPGSRGYVIGYGRRGERVGATRKRINRAVNYLRSERGIDAGRLTSTDCGPSAKAKIQLWLVPVGASPPACAGTTGRRPVTGTRRRM